jgi:hypothetical protein
MATATREQTVEGSRLAISYAHKLVWAIAAFSNSFYNAKLSDKRASASVVRLSMPTATNSNRLDASVAGNISIATSASCQMCATPLSPVPS